MIPIPSHRLIEFDMDLRVPPSLNVLAFYSFLASDWTIGRSPARDFTDRS